MNEILYSEFEKIYQPDFSLPAQIAEDYEILSCLKYSTERQVYLLEHKNKKTKVILKCGTGVQKRLLEKEYGMLEELEGKPFPLPVLFIRDETWVYSLRQYIEGRTLRELCEGKTMTEAEASETIQKICEILGRLHGRRPPLIYRDLKPENIVVAEDGSFYLIDLDTARQYKEDGKKDTVFLGTEETASPEQYGFRQTDERTDIYGLGMLLLYLTTGSYGKDTEEFAGLSKKMRRVIEKSTAFNPDDRYFSVKIFQKKLTGTYGKNGQLSAQKNRKIFFGVTIYAIILTCIFAGAIIRQYQKAQQEMQQEKPLNVSEEIVFDSPLTEEAVRKSLHKEEGEAVYAGELEQVTSLIVCGNRTFLNWEEHEEYHSNYWYEIEEQAIPKEPVSFDDIKALPNLSVLVLDGQGYEALPELEELPLKKLSLCNNGIRDVSALENSGRLQVLWLKGNPVTEITALSKLEELTEIDVSDTAVWDLSPLQGLPVHKLYCEYSNVKGEEAFLEFPNLISLRVSGMDTENIEKIVKLKSLKLLGVFESQVTDLKAFEEMYNLECLDVSGSGSLVSLEGAEKLPNLNYLGIAYTGVTKLPEDFACEHLEMLDMGGLDIADYTPLSHCPKLHTVFVMEGEEEKVQQELSEKELEILGY